MGFILSKFRSKETSKDRLEAIDKELRNIQLFQIDTELKQKRIIGRLWVYSGMAYVLSVIGFYFLAPRGRPWKEQICYILPFVFFPVLMYLVKLATAWYFDNKIVNNREKYGELKTEKQRILDDVMENETFKVAKDILEKYAPRELLPKYLAEQQRTISLSPMSGSGTPRQQTPANYNFQEGVRRRQQTLGVTSTPLRAGRPNFQQSPVTRPMTGSGPGQYLRQPTNAFPHARPQLSIMGTPSSSGVLGRGPVPAYMLPLPPTNPTVHNRSSGWIDKLVDYVVGDGAASRYALICRYCATHNGLATVEEFPYTGFRCVFCHQFNPSKQIRPIAPKLPVNEVLIEEMEQSASTIKSDTSTESDDLAADKNPETPQLPKNCDGVQSETEGPIITLEDTPPSSSESRTADGAGEKSSPEFLDHYGESEPGEDRNANENDNYNGVQSESDNVLPCSSKSVQGIKFENYNSKRPDNTDEEVSDHDSSIITKDNCNEGSQSFDCDIGSQNVVNDASDSTDITFDFEKLDLADDDLEIEKMDHS